MTSTRLGCWCSLLILLIHVTEAMASPVGVTTDSIAISCPAAKEKHYLYSLMVNYGTEPDAHYALSDMIEVVHMFETNAQLQHMLDSRLVPETLSFSTDATEMGVGDYLLSNTVHFIHGLTPSTVLIPDAVLVVDPITSAPSTRRTERNFVYLFSTIGQQLMVVMEYLSLKTLCANAALRTSTGLSTDEEALFNVVKLTAGYYGVSMCSMKTFKDDIASALVVDGITIVGGLTASNIAPLVAFLDTHPLAKVVVLFDEFTLLYYHIGLSYPTFYSLSMDRLLFVTNLPRWTFAPDNPRAVTLATYFKVFHRNMRSPASLRTFLAICTIDVLARHTPGNHVAQLSVDDFYTGKVVGLDSSFEAGPFHHYCKYPTRSPALCLENSGARNMKLMSYGSTLYSRKEKYIFGPVTVQVVLEEDHHLVVLYDNSFNNPYLYIILAMMSFLTMLLLASWILGETSCLWSDLSIQATVGFVAVRRGSANIRPSELEALLSELSDQVALLVKKHHCVEVECTSHSFAVVGRSADDVVHLMQELHDAQQKLCESHNVSKLVDFRVGVHTALCSVERAWLNGDVTALFCAVAPLLMLARCVADISLPKEVWATQWTVQALHSAMKVKVAGVYRLDDECTFVTVYRL